jgi:hypothetical protein
VLLTKVRIASDDTLKIAELGLKSRMRDHHSGEGDRVLS